MRFMEDTIDVVLWQDLFGRNESSGWNWVGVDCQHGVRYMY